MITRKASSIAERLFCALPVIWVLVIGVAMFQLALAPRLETYNAQRFLQFGLLGYSITLALWVRPKQFSRGSLLRSFSVSQRALVLIAVLMITAGIVGSLVGAKMPNWGLLELEYWALITVGVWVIFLSFRGGDSHQWQLFGGVVVFAMVLFSVRSTLEILVSYPFSNRLVATPGFSNIRMYADLAVIFIPLSWLCLFESQKMGLRLLALLANISWVYCLWLTEARSGLLSLSVAVIWGAVRYGATGRAALAVFISIFLSSWLIYWSVPVMSVDGWARDMTSSSGRWELWSLAFANFIDNFPFGIGGMMYAADGRYAVAHPHNLILLILAEWGGLVLAGILILACLAIYKVLHAGGGGLSPNVRIPVAIALLAGLINAQFSAGPITPLGAASMILAFGAYLAIVFPRTKIFEKGLSLSGSGRFIWAFCMCIWVHASVTGLELYGLAEKSTQECAELSGGTVFPRFWVQGRLDCGSSGFGF